VGLSSAFIKLARAGRLRSAAKPSTCAQLRQVLSELVANRASTTGSFELVRSWNQDSPGSILFFMSDVTRILQQIDRGDPTASKELLPLVYDELRKLAAARLANEKPGQTLQPTALVHEAFLRLIGGDAEQNWDSSGHFFAAAAEAMRRILVEQARRKQSLRSGGKHNRVELPDVAAEEPADSTDLVALDDALKKLEDLHPRKAQLVKLRFFAGLTIERAAEALAIATSTADADWAFAKGWLKLEMRKRE
jgi:RNA polymerase sigma factor (TIGR02999 family)